MRHIPFAASRPTAALAALILAAVTAGAATERGTAEPGVPDGEAAAETAAEESPHERREPYRIGPEDVLRLQVVGHPEFEATATVNADGSIVLPILKDVKVGGLDLDQARTALTRTIADGYVRDPKVVLEITEYNNMKVWVFGAVAEPGEHRLKGPTTILDLLRSVGDVRAIASAVVTIERSQVRSATDDAGRTLPYTETDTIEVNLEELLREGNLAHNIDLRNGDKIHVPPRSARVGAFGEVSSPGYYPFQDGMTLSELIQLAGGLTEFANEKKIRIKRAQQDKAIRVNLEELYKKGNEGANLPLEEGDLVLVNSSFFF